MNLSLIFNILKELGIPVVAIVLMGGVGATGYFVWKIMTNHLRHIAIDIKEVLAKIGVLDEKVDKIDNRVNWLEGKVGRE